MNYYMVISYGFNQIVHLFKLKAMRELNDDAQEGCSVKKIKKIQNNLYDIIISKDLFKNNS